MTMDFQAFMLIALVILGLIIAYDHFKNAPVRAAAMAKAKEKSDFDEEEQNRIIAPSLLVDYSRSFFPIILIVLVLRGFVVEPFRIPSSSMMPTLVAGDFILVNKYVYGLRLPLFGTEVLDTGKPKHGDVIVFRFPNNPSVDYIKRVVGVGGDKIAYYNKILYINGKQAVQTKVEISDDIEARLESQGGLVLTEQFGTADHKIVVMKRRQSGDGEFVVPEGRYFVMGDNRDNSNDSRFWGTVPDENLVGKAFMIWMSWDNNNSRIAWERIGDSIN